MRLPLLTIWLWCGVAAADECTQAPTRCEKAQLLVTAMGYKTMSEKYIEACLQAAAKASPAELAKIDHAARAAVETNSEQRSRMEAAFRDYQAEACPDKLRTTILNAYRQAWAAALSEEQLDATLAFVNSPTGRLFASRFPEVYASVQKDVYAAWGKANQDAYSRYHRHLQAILAE